MSEKAIPTGSVPESYPGQRLGLPREGRGSLASWQTRFAAVVIDWAASMAVAVGFFGSSVLVSNDWRAWMILSVFFVESTVLSALAGGSFGQLLTRTAVVRLDAKPLGFLLAIIRAMLVCVVLPALVIGADRRGLHDVLLGTVVIRRR